MMYLLSIFTMGAGGAVGFYIAWFIKSKELDLKDKELMLKNQELVIEKRALEERAKDIEQLEARFKAIASDVMRLHSKDFIDEFEKARKVHNTDIENKEKNFEKIAENISISMGAVDKRMVEFEKQRIEQVGALGESIKNVLDTGTKMQEAALSLKSVLSSASAVRGRWGEAVLKNLLEQSGLTEGIDFQIQETITGDGISLRPDVIINLPGGLQLAIDSKAGLEEFFKAVEEKDPEKKQSHIIKFAQNIRGHIKDLSSKEYQRHLDNRIPYVVMFIPGEAAVRAVFEQDIDMYREAQEKRVMLASPATIMPLILLISHAWKQQKTVENASKLAQEITELGSRLKTFLGHVVGIGSSLSQATKKFNDAASSWDARVHPKIEQITILGGNLQLEGQISQIEAEPRAPGKLTLDKDTIK
ncbi:MAG: DNA recombination protein RmuC [Parcubacteria group bacterium]